MAGAVTPATQVETLHVKQIFQAVRTAGGGVETFAHGLGYIPTYIIVQPLAAINQAAQPTADAADVTVNMSGGGDILIIAF